MFPFITTTWNPLGGRCPHRCIYCWSQGEKGLINRYNMQKYWGEPRLIEKELNLRFKPGEFVFVQDMSDLWARKVPSEMIAKVLDVVEASPHATFLFLTKNPLRYVTFMDRLEALGNIILGCTVESNQYNWLLSEYRMGHGLVRYDEISKAPPPPKRLNVMKNIRRDSSMYVNMKASSSSGKENDRGSGMVRGVGFEPTACWRHLPQTPIFYASRRVIDDS